MFEVVARHWEIFFFLLSSPKCDLGEVKKAMFQGLAWHFELIFGLVEHQNFNLVEVKKKIFFKDSNCTFNLFSSSGPAQNVTCVK